MLALISGWLTSVKPFRQLVSGGFSLLGQY